MVTILVATFLLAGPTTAHAQQIPPHVFIGSASIDGNPVPDGTGIVAFIDGEAVGKTVVEGGTYTLMVEQPQGRSFSGRIIQFTVGDQKAGESQAWEQGGAHELNLHAGGGGAGPADSLQGALECIARVLGRMPMGPQDLDDQERMKVFQACPEVRENLGAFTQNQPAPQNQQSGGSSQTDQMRNELRQIEQEIARVEREAPIKIQQELEQLDQEIANVDRDLWDQLQFELDRLDQERFDTERQMQQELRSADFRRHSQIENKYRRILDQLERERFETERRTQVQIAQEKGRLMRNRDDTERQLWEEKQREINRLEQRRFELEDAIERERFASEQRQRDEEDRRRFERERQMEEQRFKQQEELERQRIEQDRQRFEQERKLEEERMQRERQLEEQRFRQQEQLDRERIDQDRQRLEQERLLNQNRFNQGVQIQTGQDRNLLEPLGSAGRNLPTRGFFTNSSTGEISDIDKILDPTSLAVLGILLTLVATSLSLVKGS